MPEKKRTVARANDRRSPCPLACSLDILGDRWTLLVIRDLLSGPKRFKDFMASPERIPTNLLSDRLARLKQHGLIAQVPRADGAKHLAYRLTSKGNALRSTLRAMRDWALDWLPGTRVLVQTTK